MTRHTPDLAIVAEHIAALRAHVDSECVSIDVLSVRFPILMLRVVRHIHWDGLGCEELREAAEYLIALSKEVMEKHNNERGEMWDRLSELEGAITGVPVQRRRPVPGLEG